MRFRSQTSRWLEQELGLTAGDGKNSAKLDGKICRVKTESSSGSPSHEIEAGLGEKIFYGKKEKWSSAWAHFSRKRCHRSRRLAGRKLTPEDKTRMAAGIFESTTHAARSRAKHAAQENERRTRLGELGC
jgi:hypothetical protein